jgi:hypothetical protein
MGIEKSSTQQLIQLRKKLTPEVAQAAIVRLSNTPIRAAGTFILGGVGESESMILDTIDWASRSGLDLAQFNPLALYPGTALYREVYGNEPWLELCLDRAIAPAGDILWSSAATPLNLILSLTHSAYEAFYTEQRLERSRLRVGLGETMSLPQTYQVLRQRGKSWGSC